MLTAKERSVSLGRFTARLTPNLCAVTIRTAPTSAGSGSGSGGGGSWFDAKAVSAVLTAVSSRTVHVLQLNASAGDSVSAAAVFVVSRSADSNNADLTGLTEQLGSKAVVCVVEPCALLSSPPISHIPAVMEYARAETSGGDSKSQAKSKLLHFSCDGGSSQFIIPETSVDTVVTDLQYFVTAAEPETHATGTAAAAGTDAKSDSAAAAAAAAAAAHDDHRTESVKQTTTKLTLQPW